MDSENSEPKNLRTSQTLNQDQTDRPVQRSPNIKKDHDYFRQLSESMQEVSFLLECPGCKTLYITPSVETFWSFKSGDVHQRPDQWLNTIHLEDRARVENTIAQDLSSDGTDIEYRVQCSNGRAHCIPITDDTGLVRQLVCQVTDITEQKQPQKALIANEACFRSTFEQVVVGIAHLSYDGCYERVNQQFCDILGFSASELVGNSLCEWTNHKDPNNDITPWEQLWQGQLTAYTLQEQYMRKDSSTIWLKVTISHMQAPGIESEYAVLVVQDISQHKAHEQYISKYQQQLKALISKMTLADEHFKRQVATQIHDTIGQSLAFSKSKLESLKENLSGGEVYDTLTSTCKILDEAFMAFQSLMMQLSYPVFAVLGLERGIEQWLSDVITSKHDIQTQFIADPYEKPLDEDLRMILFRGVRELLNNVIKHARATQITVSVFRADERVLIIVQDNGSGCDPAKALTKGNSLGLLSIREALEGLGGTLQLDTRLGHGCRVMLSAPLALTVSGL